MPDTRRAEGAAVEVDVRVPAPGGRWSEWHPVPACRPAGDHRRAPTHRVFATPSGIDLADGTRAPLGVVGDDVVDVTHLWKES